MLWDEHPELGLLQRWTAAIEDIALKEWLGKFAPLLMIDCVRSLRFSTTSSSRASASSAPAAPQARTQWTARLLECQPV